ncbi:UDP-N-acetylmuramate dehydrogenase [Sediminitomix flava]|uniref:UDP-N-acetylenolpyruvoylglucosamine reductase n=1 Tax=Sediminitomix flava TaxID=379075 RepID=A0A315Z6A3_SEDFL|nr:UDP-N-acetylmuramate dehydrogenase [Sediminitomix flava]PWJ38616.1 UDP-N-acetylmuramate dehydrogenase [Sediminitomix flava]
MIQIEKDISIHPFNTFGARQNTSYFLRISDIGGLQNFIDNKGFELDQIMILGGGSNVLFTKDYNGIILKNEIKGIDVEKENDEFVWLKIGGGENWHELVLYTVENNWQGIENLSLIPGTVGASPIQNIGAYGVEVKDTFESLEAFELETGTIKSFTKDDCGFGYRDSVFKRHLKGKYFITSVTLKLRKTNHAYNTSYGAIENMLQEKGISELSPKTISETVIAIRNSKLPNPEDIGNCGSFFKNPVISTEDYKSLKEEYPSIPGYVLSESEVKVPAGWLIDQSGWKGKVIGNVGTYEKQALVLINATGMATGEEAWSYAQEVKQSVFKKFNIEINPEVNII